MFIVSFRKELESAAKFLQKHNSRAIIIAKQLWKRFSFCCHVTYFDETDSYIVHCYYLCAAFMAQFYLEKKIAYGPSLAAIP
jgi:hypothetical protein